MKLDVRDILRDSLISLAILGMIGGSVNSNIANAKHRRYHYRTHRIYRRSIHRHNRKHYRYNRRYHHKRHFRRTRRSVKHPKYMWSYAEDSKGHYFPYRVRITKAYYRHHKLIYDYHISNRHYIKTYGKGQANGFDYARSPHVFYSNWAKAKRAAKSDQKIIDEDNEDADSSDSNSGSNSDSNTDQNSNLNSSSNSNSNSNLNTNVMPNPNPNNNSTPAPASNIQNNLPEFRSEMMSLINQDRADSTGNPPLQESPALDRIAQIRAQQASTPAQKNQSDPHMDPATNKAYYEEVGSQLGYNVDAFGSDDHSASGENLAWGYTTPNDFNNGWYTKEKPYNGGHYRNIVGDSSTTSHYKFVGIGVYHNTGSEVFSENVTND